MSNAAHPNQSDEAVLSLFYRSCWIDHADKKGEFASDRCAALPPEL